MVLRANVNGQTHIVLLDAGDRHLVYRIIVDDKQELEWIRWAGNDKVLFSLSQPGRLFDQEIRFTRLFYFDIPSRAMHPLAKREEGPIGDDLLYTDPEGRFVLLAIQRTVYDWPSVWRFPLEPDAGNKARSVQASKAGIWDWYADDAGNVRMGFEFVSKTLKVWYRSKPEDDLKLIARMGKDDFDEKIWDVARIVNGSDEGYVLEKSGDTVALRRFNYATRTSGEIVYQNPTWDVTEAEIDKDGKPLAAYYTDDKAHVVWFDSAMKSLQARLERALPGMDVWMMSRARDNSRMLVYTGREDDPGALYLYTAANRSLEFIANYRPQLDQGQLARPRPISYEARDKTRIHGYLTLPRGRDPKGLPLIILPHGGPYDVRDTLTYSDEVQLLANRGYAVLQPNFRGSGGYGDGFVKIGNGQIGRKMQDDIDDAMDWAVREGIADAARVCVVGSSYGGYAALWAVIRNPERYRCAASFAGVTDWKRQLSYSNRNVDDAKSRRDWRATVTGDEGFDLDTVSPARQIARLTRPALVAHGNKDSRVPFSQFKSLRDAASRAKINLDLLEMPGVGHGFARPEDEQRWYETLDAFLARNNPAD